MNRKLIAIDLDGTLLRSNHSISEQTQKLLMSLDQEGHLVTIATGRIFSSANAVSKTIGLDVSLVACNGCIVHDKRQGFIKDQTFDKNKLREVINICNSHGIYYHYYSKDIIYCNRLGHTSRAFLESLKHTEHPHVKDVIINENFEEILKTDTPMYKLAIEQDGTYDFEEVRRQIEACEGLTTVFSNKSLLDVMPQGTTKWTAIAELMNKNNIAREDVIVLGDSPNDFEMIQNAGVGIAMENAVPEIKKIADHITKTNNEDGVYHFLKGYFKR